MGSWNGTCGVSQLPIRINDDVAVIFMKKNEYGRVFDYNGCVYSDNFFQPVSPAIFGTYNDYGRINFEQADERIIDSLYGNVDLKKLSLNELVKEKSDELGLYIMLIHLPIYNAMIDEFGSRKEFFTQGKTLKEFNEDEIFRYLKLMRAKESPFKLEFDPEIDYSHFKRKAELRLDFYSDPSIYKDDLNDSLIDKLVELFVLEYAMETSRKLWIPQAGNGSQDIEYELTNIISEIASELKNDDDF